MKLSELLKSELIVLGIEAHDKWELIARMAQILGKSQSISDVEKLEQAMVEREKTMTTGLGHGVAMPHAMCDCVDDIVVAAATMKSPLDFEAIDLQPISIVFAIASPLDRDKRYMLLLSQIARLFSSHDFAGKLLSASSPDEFLEIIAQ